MNLCARITVLNFGRVITTGAPSEVRGHPEVIEAYLGAEERYAG
jgi:branched-chain amino acid transport system ATP-binding protein